MIDITNVSEYTVTGSFTIAGKVSADETSRDEAKNVTLKYVLKNVPLASIIHSSLKDKKIVWQAGARKNHSKIVDGSVIEVNYTGGVVPQDPEEAMQARLAAMTPEAREAWFQAQMAKFNK